MKQAAQKKLVVIRIVRNELTYREDQIDQTAVAVDQFIKSTAWVANKLKADKQLENCYWVRDAEFTKSGLQTILRVAR